MQVRMEAQGAAAAARRPQRATRGAAGASQMDVTAAKEEADTQGMDKNTADDAPGKLKPM